MINNKSITFETKCYENDWEYILKGTYLSEMINRCAVNFDCKQLVINNVKDRSIVEEYAQKMVVKGIIDVYYFTEDSEDDVLSFFDLAKQDLGRGFVYSISELTGIYKCTTDYLLHFSSDAYLSKNSGKIHWIEDAIDTMSAHPKLVIATPTWNYLYLTAKAESYNSIGSFWVAQGFSDQCYLIPLEIFKRSIYSESHPFSERYPKYGGELFEKKVDAFLRNHDYYRLIHKKATYIHANFPKTEFKKEIYFFVTKTLRNEFSSIGRSPSSIKRIYDLIVSVLKTIFCRYKNMTHKDF